MKVGVVCRTNSRGLDIQTAEAARNLDASVLVVNVVNQSSPLFPSDFSRYPGAPIVDCRPGWKLDDRIVRCWLEGVDVVYSAETFYDDRFTAWAREAKAATVVHANPEFVPPGGQGWAIGDPTTWWSATSWRQRFMPPETRVMPFPVATDRFTPVEPYDGPCRWLHVAGKRAMHDRNGTESVLDALSLLREPCEVTICTQDPELPAPLTPPAHVKVTVSTGGVPDYWSLYPGHDALVMPRRYGGLCLPVQESMAAGMAVLMTDAEPNRDWPVALVPVTFGPLAPMPAGKIPVASADPVELAAAMDALADPAVRHARQAQSREWAEGHSWETLGPQWLDEFTALSCALR